MSGQIFISYRREESRWSARSLHDRLCRDFDPEQIFMDIDAIALGADFVKSIETTVAKCDVLIAVIGNNWLTSKDDHGDRRLDNPEDFVRMEIGAALKREISVIPVLVDGALMPRATDLPEDLKLLVRRNALQITDTSFDGDCQRLAAAIRLVLQKAPAVEQERPIATSTPPAQPESDKSSTETAKVVHPLPAKAFKPDHVKPPPPKQRIAFLATAAVLVLAGVTYLAIVAFHSRPPPSPSHPVPAVTPIPPVIVTPTVGEKVPPTPEVTVQPTTQPTARATPTPQPTTPPPTRSPERTPEPVVKGIDDYFGALPPQDFTKSAPSDLLQIIRSGGKNILDRPNGYMFLNGDRAQVSLQIALFPDASQRPFLAIAWGNMGGPDFTHLSFFTERDGRMVPAKRTILPVGDSDELRFELPRIGLTLVVRDSSGKVLSKWTWNGERARFESAK